MPAIARHAQPVKPAGMIVIELDRKLL